MSPKFNIVFILSTNHLNIVSSKIWDIQNLILDLSIFSVYGHGAWIEDPVL